jgi:hypothetical protein
MTSPALLADALPKGARLAGSRRSAARLFLSEKAVIGGVPFGNFAADRLLAGNLRQGPCTKERPHDRSLIDAHLAGVIAGEWRAYARASDDAERDGLQPWADVIGEADTHKGTATMDSPVVTICKSFVEAGKSFIGETELTKMIEDHALRDRRDGETEAKCFARHFTPTMSKVACFGRPLPFAKAPTCGRLAAMMLMRRGLMPSCKGWPSSDANASRA